MAHVEIEDAGEFPERIHRTPKIVSKYLVRPRMLPEEIAIAIRSGTLPSSFVEHGYTQGGDRITRRVTDGQASYFHTEGGSIQMEDVPEGVGGRIKTYKEISAEKFQELWQRTASNRIAKTGYDITPQIGPTTFLDVYHGGETNGCLLINIEFPNLTEAEKFKAPEWFGVNVTEVISSRSLAKGGKEVMIFNNSDRLSVSK